MYCKGIDIKMICTVCYAIGDSVIVKSGSYRLQLILYLFGIIPGILYRKWRDSTARRACAHCKQDALVSLYTHQGRRVYMQKLKHDER
jgi:hypothetical protein